jgi:hypothetical protein
MDVDVIPFTYIMFCLEIAHTHKHQCKKWPTHSLNSLDSLVALLLLCLSCSSCEEYMLLVGYDWRRSSTNYTKRIARSVFCYKEAVVQAAAADQELLPLCLKLNVYFPVPCKKSIQCNHVRILCSSSSKHMSYAMQLVQRRKERNYSFFCDHEFIASLFEQQQI